jgi:hypothetical protein
LAALAIGWILEVSFFWVSSSFFSTDFVLSWVFSKFYPKDFAPICIFSKFYPNDFALICIFSKFHPTKLVQWFRGPLPPKTPAKGKSVSPLETPRPKGFALWTPREPYRNGAVWKCREFSERTNVPAGLG